LPDFPSLTRPGIVPRYLVKGGARTAHGVSATF